MSDFVRPVRCFKCLGYGHVAAAFKSDSLCEHCGKRSGHMRAGCPKSTELPVCVNCQRVGKECGHDVRSRDCPAFQRALERVKRITAYE